MNKTNKKNNKKAKYYSGYYDVYKIIRKTSTNPSGYKIIATAQKPIEPKKYYTEKQLMYLLSLDARCNFPEIKKDDYIVIVLKTINDYYK